MTINLKERDDSYFEGLAEMLNVDPKLVQFISENINLFAMRRHISQNYAYYDLFKRVINVPGSVAEFGVFWGNGLFNWLNLMETFLPLDRGRKVFGFDDFQGYNRELGFEDTKGVDYIENIRGNFGLDSDRIIRLTQIKNSDNIIPFDERCILYNGNIFDTFSEFENENPGVRLSLVVADLNLRKPTKFVIEKSWKLMAPGAIMIFRGYGSKPWEGESAAVDEFIAENKIRKLETIPYNNTPGAFIIKGEE